MNKLMQYSRSLLSVLMIVALAITFSFSNITKNDYVHAAEAKVVVRGGSAFDESGNRLVLKGKTLGLGPAQGVYNDLIISTEWFSSNSAVMKITEGKYKSECIVKAVGVGTCVIDGVTESELLWPTYDYQIMHNEHKFRVVEKIKSITVPSKVTIYVGSPKKLKYETNPSSIYSQYMSGLSFKSSNKSVATVDSDGKVTGKKSGTVTITVKTDSGLKKSCKVTVKRPTLKSLRISEKKVTLEQGKSKTLKVSYVPEGAYGKVTWSSNNKKVATVSSKGKVIAKKAGTATITAKTSNGKKITCKVTVPKKPTSVKLNKSKVSLTRGKTYTLKATFKPTGAYAKVTWSSNDKSVATVSSNGKITAKKVGTATITGKTSNGKKATCKVTVTKPPISEICLSSTELTLWEGETSTLTCKKTPTDGVGKISYSSSNTSVATVSSSGKVTAKKTGNAVITAKVSSKVQAKCTVTVKRRPSATSVAIYDEESYLQAGKTLQLRARAYPEETGDPIYWSSSDTSVATVDASGKVLAKSSGVVTITATAGSAEVGIKLIVTEGPWLDLSNGDISIYDDYATQGDKKVVFSQDATLTIGQTWGSSNIIFNNNEDIRVVFAELSVKSGYVRFDGNAAANVTIETLKDTENVFSTSTYPFKGVGYSTLILQGKGFLHLEAAKGSAFVGGNLCIPSGDVYFSINYGESKAAIDCNYLEIGSGAEVNVWADSRPYSCQQTPKIATGTLYYQGDLY